MTAAVFNSGDMQKLIALGTIRAFSKNTMLLQEGDRSDQLYVVMSGRLKVFLADADGKEVTIDSIGPQQLFGEMTLDGEPRSASVITTEASNLCVVQHEQFKRFLADNPQAALALIVALIRRARNLTRTVGNLALLDVYEPRRSFIDRKRNSRKRATRRRGKNFTSGYRQKSRVVTGNGFAHTGRFKRRRLYLDGQ